MLRTAHLRLFASYCGGQASSSGHSYNFISQAPSLSAAFNSTNTKNVDDDGIKREHSSSPSPTGRLSESERRAMIERIIRVDHAGELGADRIYAGQLAVLKNSSVAGVIKHMWEQEKDHLNIMERLIAQRNVNPTVLSPLWSLAGFVLGASSAMLGKEGAMACTVAVEELIGQHYNDQIRELMDDDPELHAHLLKIISRLRDEELEHHDTGLEHNALQAPFFSVMKFTIQTGCRAAIWVSEKV